jgi:hypothetical protein
VKTGKLVLKEGNVREGEDEVRFGWLREDCCSQNATLL